MKICSRLKWTARHCVTEEVIVREGPHLSTFLDICQAHEVAAWDTLNLQTNREVSQSERRDAAVRTH